jgi:hypothetical protein
MTSNPSEPVKKLFMRQIPLPVLGASLAMTFLCSCTTAPNGVRNYDGRPQVYNMREMEQPIILNDNPFLLSGTNSPPKLTKVDTYKAEVGHSQMDTEDGSGQGMDTKTSDDNEAQANAFLKIGGQPNRTIRNLSLGAGSGMFNGIFFIFNGSAINSTGDVVEFESSVTNAPPSTPAGTETNTITIHSTQITQRTNP